MDKKNNLTVEETFNLARINHLKNNFNIAQDLYNQILEKNPVHVGALNNLGAILISLKDFKKAEIFFKKIVEINPNDSNQHFNLGVVYFNMYEFLKAKSYFEKAIEINPNHTNAHTNLAEVFQNLGENLKAINCLQKAIKIDPNSTYIINTLGNLFHLIDDDEKAINSYEKIIRIDPDYADAYNNLGAVYNNLLEYQKAIEYYEKAIEIEPSHINAHYNIANLYQKLENYPKAKKIFEKVIEISPNHKNAYFNLGFVEKKLGKDQKAIKCFEKAIKIDPNNISSLNTLIIFLNSYQFKDQSEIHNITFKDSYLFLFKKNNIKHSLFILNAIQYLLSIYGHHQLLNIINSASSLLSNKNIQSLMKEELFQLMLQKSIVTNQLLEKLLTTLRYELIVALDNPNKDIFKEYLDFIISLAEQCWLNEFVYINSEKETNQIIKLKNKIESDKTINEIEIVILACYIPLISSQIITQKLIDYESTNYLFNDLIKMQIREPLNEKEISKTIKSQDEISDTVSIKVREQYEEHPYPRWRYTHENQPQIFLQKLNFDLKPNKINNVNNKLNKPNVLIAGCGTGTHAINSIRYRGANILGVDLSLASLSYAIRKTKELGYENIQYLHTDILQLKKLNRKFDIIECVGTLHHMNDPIAGLKVLLDILEPHGFLKLGLYSETARQHIIKGRELIKNKKFKNTNEDIRTCRQEIFNEKQDLLLKKITNSADFYTTSTVRDLLFHVQEHRFTIPEISKILKDLNLEFLGFSFQHELIKNTYLKKFPDDKNNISLDNWHQFEQDNPDIFTQMYNFWVRKLD